MSIPKYFELYKPFLDCIRDSKVHSIKEIRETVAKIINISDSELKELLPSGKQTVFHNRLGWSSTYLKKAGLIEKMSRGMFVITAEGKKVLDTNPPVIDDTYLSKYPSFRSFKSPEENDDNENNITLSENTPQDDLDKAFKRINTSLEDELLTEIIKQSSIFFEHLVVTLLEKMGYGGSLKNPGTVTQQSGDEGIDGVICEDKLGFNLIYIQAKKWNGDASIGRPEIQKFVGALAGQGANKGLFITTAAFTKEAYTYAEKQHTTKVVLVDGIRLARLMIEYNLGVSIETIYEIKKIDTDFFAE